MPLLLPEDLSWSAREPIQKNYNENPSTRAELEAMFGKWNVWDPDEMRAEFVVLGFAAPYVRVERRGVPEHLFFQHEPRFYWRPQFYPVAARQRWGSKQSGGRRVKVVCSIGQKRPEWIVRDEGRLPPALERGPHSMSESYLREHFFLLPDPEFA